ncbi:MAG TPA: tetratricopeptide repeat protein [Sandaracinaceae bacterium LLY-WYZ-13_1]|nr:tetratricopeptide repeat protein [Sandaracinaceae bacterium LLY-WYZ-13_1]
MLLVGLVLAGCVPTLSQPRGEAHLAAMREATTHHHHGRMDEAAAAWGEASRAAERRVDRDEADYRRARALLRVERTDEALAILDDLAARRPVGRRTVRARFDAALIRLDRGEAAPAMEAFEHIVREHPGDGPASRSLRLWMDHHEDEPDAQLAFLRALYERVGDTDLGDDVLTFVAAIHRARGERDAAIAAYERLLEDHPYPHGQRWDETLHRLADMAVEAEDYDAAVAYLERMIAIHAHTITPGSQTLPGMPRARLRIARIYRDHLDDPDRAAAHFRGTHDRFDTSRLRDDALYELGAMWLDRGRRDEGCRVLEEVVREFEVGHARREAAERLERDCPRGR